jgi:hypothetical protein
MSSQIPDFGDFEFEPEEEHDPGDETIFAATPDMPLANKLANDEETAAELSIPASGTPHSVSGQAAQAAYKAAQQATSVIQPPLEPQRAAWSAALAEEATLMETLATAAGRATNLAEALALAAALPVLSLRLTPHCYRALWPLLPALVQGVQGIVRVLYSRPSTRPFICLLPVILESTAAQLADQVTADRSPTPMTAAKVLAFHTEQTLLQQTRQTVNRSRRNTWQRNGHGYRS